MAELESNPFVPESQNIEEEWRVIPDFPNYEASSHGRIRRCIHAGRSGGKILKPYINRCGYAIVSIAGKAAQSPQTVHRLVMAAFLYPVTGRMVQVNHKDGDKLNNQLSNLEYVTPSQNTKHAIQLGLRAAFPNRRRVARGDTHYSRTKPEKVPRGSRHGRAKIDEETAQRIRQVYTEIRSYRKVAEMFGLGRTTVIHIIKQDTWKPAK